MAGACGNRTHPARFWPGNNGFEDREGHQNLIRSQ